MRKNYLAYPVEFVDDAFGDSDALAKVLQPPKRKAPRVLIVADQNVVQHTEGLGSRIGRYVKRTGIELAASPVVVGGGEKIKSDDFQTAQRVMSAMIEAKLGRGDVVLAIGGGTLLDVAGWAAAQTAGGIPLVRMPTTPEAMTDAAYADRALLDVAFAKDAAGVASVPAGVVIDVTFAKTVLDGVWRGGIGDPVRLAVAKDASLLGKIAENAQAYRARSVEALGEIVRGVGKVRASKGATTFALWLAARLQEMSFYKLPHGYAVSMAVLVAMSCDVVRGAIGEDERASVHALLEECGALDGLCHSKHLLQQTDALLEGAASWTRAYGEIDRLKSIGSVEAAPPPDAALLGEALKYLLSLPAER